jgi:hypothetical protein
MVRPLQGRKVFGAHVRRLRLRLLTVSRFAGLLPSLGLAYLLRKEASRNSSKTANPNFYVAHPNFFSGL